MTRIFPGSIPSLKQHSFFYSLSFYLKSSLREARRRKVYFILALLSTLIVVAATAVSQTIIEYTPLIFLKLSETNAGAIDTTVNSQTLSFVENDGVSSMRVSRPLTFNTTNIHPIIDPVYPGSMTARYTFSGSSFKVNNTKDPACNSTTNPPYNNCSSFRSDVVLQNTQIETELGMAPAYPLPNAIPFGTIIISEKLASSADLTKGDKVTMVLDVTNLLRDVCLQFNSHQNLTSKKIGETKFNRPALAYIPVTVGDVVGPMAGKFPQSSSADPVIMEYTSFFVLLAENMPKVNARTHISYASYTSFLKNENPLDYAGQILFNMKDRQTVYKNSNFDKIQDEIVGFSSEISEALGVFPFTIGMPVYDQLKTLKFAGLFLGIALNIIVVILFLLSVILIYNILLVTVETKTFEFGVIRMVGLTKIGIAQMILVQALLFVIPGIIAGLTISIPLLKFVGQKLHDLIQADIPMFPTGEALFWSIFIGLIIPVISSYYPMKAALSKDLGSTLDLSRSKTSAVQISIEITGKRFPWTSVTFGILSLVFGIAIYILLPKSLLSFDAGLLLAIFFVILLGLLIGLALLSLNFQHTMEKLLTMIFFFWTNSSFKALIQNNLAAHKLRNRQTAIMYSLALGFIIFIVVSLRQQLSNMVYKVEATKGADFQITVSGGSTLDYVTLDKTIQANLTHAVESYAWITQSLASFVGSAADIEVTNKGKLYSVTPKIRGVSVNIFKTVKTDFTKVDECDENTGLDLGEQLYTPRGSQGVIVGSTYKKQIGVSTDIHDTLLVVKNDGIYTTSEELRVLATMDSAAGFTFSNLPSVISQDMLVSLPTYMRLANNMTNNQSSIPITRLVIKVKDGKSANADMIYKEFTRLQKSSYSALQIWDLRDEQKSLETNQNAISLIFNSVEIVAMVLSMFSLISSMTTNIMQQTKEIAVMRAVGFSKIKVNLIYVSEAFILVISSALFGVLIGTAVAWILASQSVLFSQLPMFFNFPGKDCLVIFIAAIISAFLSAYLPAHRITKLPIAKIIRLGS